MRALAFVLCVVVSALLGPDIGRAQSFDASLGAVTVDLSSPKVYTPDDHGAPWMYHQFFNKPERGWYVDVRSLIRRVIGNSGIFLSTAPERVTIDASLEELEEHAPSYDVELTMGIRYRIRDASGLVLYERLVMSEGQSTVGEHFDGASRVEKGIARATESNASAFVAMMNKDLAPGLAELRRRASNVQTTRVTPSSPASTPPTRFHAEPVVIRFNAGPSRPKDIAVIIGNADYGGAIPDVLPALADAAGFKQYALTALGIREGNIIDLRNAGQAELFSVFGTESSHRGKLFNWVQPGVSNVYVYYAGHGAPGRSGAAYLVPVDADPATLHLNGLRLERLYLNLAQIPARSITVVLEACFSGVSQGGAVISNASPVFLRTKAPPIPKGISVITAGSPNQMASWGTDGRHSLFTTHYLKAMSGEADRKPYGNGDGNVTLAELGAYLKDTLTYSVRRAYGRDQTAVIAEGAGR